LVPQTKYTVPEGILNYGGESRLELAAWALVSRGAAVPGLMLRAGTPVLTGSKEVEVVDVPAWKANHGADERKETVIQRRRLDLGTGKGKQ
jgi:hypothetical protein